MLVSCVVDVVVVICDVVVRCRCVLLWRGLLVLWLSAAIWRVLSIAAAACRCCSLLRVVVRGVLVSEWVVCCCCCCLMLFDV